MPTDYSQIERKAKEEPAPAPQTPTEPTQERAIVQQGGGPTGPTRAQMLKAARMADLAPVRPSRSGTQQASMDGGAGARPSGKLYNPNGLTPAFDCQVDAGTNIPAMTEQRLTSESPGTVSAVAMRDIWSSDKACLAVPRGTRFVGRYQTAVSEGQVRMGIIWTGLTRPPPRKDTIELNDTVAGDPDGTAGVTGEVNSHFWRKLAYVTAASLLDIGKTAITAGGEGGIGAAVAGIFADRAASPIDEWAKRQLDIPPVIEVKPREISIVLAQHLPMDDFRGGR
jgi:type IV secretion system protein VirB10